MKTKNNQTHIKVTIIATRYGWRVENNVTGANVFGKRIVWGKTLVRACNENHLTVCNPDALIFPLSQQLQFTA